MGNVSKEGDIKSNEDDYGKLMNDEWRYLERYEKDFKDDWNIKGDGWIILNVKCDGEMVSEEKENDRIWI